MNLANTIRNMGQSLEEGNMAKAGKEIASVKDPINKKELSSIGQLLQNLERQSILQKGQTLAKLGAQIQSLDTDVREVVMGILKKYKLFEDFVAESPEDKEPASMDEKSMALRQAEFIQYVGEEIEEFLEGDNPFPEWMQNKLSELHTKAEDVHSAMAGEYEDDDDDEEELDEDFYNVVYRDKSGKVQGEKEFNSKSAAEKYAKLGNSRDKVGGKYTVNLVRDGGMGRRNEEVELEESPMVTFTVPNVDSAMARQLEKLAKENGVEYSRQGRTVVLKGPRIDVTTIRTKMGLAQTNLKMVPVKEDVDLGEAMYSWNDVNSALTKANYMRKNPAEIMKVADKFDHKSGKDKKFSLADVKKNLSAAGIDGAKQHDVMKHIKEGVEMDINESFELAFEEEITEAKYQVDIKGAGRETVMAKNEREAIAKAAKKMKVHSYKTPDVTVKLMEEVEEKLSLEDTLKAIWEGKMDPVNKKALKKDFDDRKDKDIDNDGDVDDSDEYLHKRRKAVSKAVEKDSDKAEKDQEKEVSDKEDEPKGTIGKTKKQTKVDVNPSLDEEREMTDAEMKKRDEIMKGLEKKKDEFVKKYGDRAKEVMARTAIKMAMKESTAAYGKSQQAIADKKKNDAISSSDKNKLGKLADLMNREKQLKNKTK